MTTNETPDQFRERIGRTSHAAMLRYIDDDGTAPTWEQEDDGFRDGVTDTALAVYTQALRDVYAEAKRVAHGYMGAGSVYRHIEYFAAERGIDLTNAEGK